MKEEKHTCDICHEERDLSELTYFDESYLCEDCLLYTSPSPRDA